MILLCSGIDPVLKKQNTILKRLSAFTFIREDQRIEFDSQGCVKPKAIHELHVYDHKRHINDWLIQTILGINSLKGVGTFDFF